MRVFLALLPAYVFSIFYRSFLSVIAEPVMADLAIGPAALGRIGAAWFIAFAAMQFPVGYALDRFGPGRTIGWLTGFGVAGALLFALAVREWHALTAMALIGIGCSPVLMAALVLFAKSGSAAGFAGLSSLFVGFGSLGNLLGSAPLADAAVAFGWRPTMLVLALAFGAAWVLVLVALRDPGPADAAPIAGPLAGIGRIVAIRPLWFILPITFFAYAILATTRGLWIAPYLGSVNGLTPEARGDGALVMAVAMTVSPFFFAWLAPRIGGPKTTVLVSTVLMALSFALLAAVGPNGATAAITLFALIGLVGFNYTMVMAHARAFFPPDLIGRGMTFMNFFFIAGASFVQAFSGWLLELRLPTQGPAAAYAEMFWLFAAVLLVSALIHGRAPRTAPT